MNHLSFIRFIFSTASAATLLLSPDEAALGEIIPADRLASWYGNVGVPGGIPTNRTQFKDVVADYGADPTGVNDCQPAFQSCLNDCPAGKYCNVPAGHFKLHNIITQWFTGSNNKTIRGAGQGVTFLEPDFHDGRVFDIGTSPGNTLFVHPILSGATKGSTSITVNNASDFTVGGYLWIKPTNQTWVHALGFTMPDPTNRLIVVTVKIDSISSNTITFEPPCPFDFSGMSPTATAPQYPSNQFLPVTGFGIENMTFDLANVATALCAIAMTNTWGCWVKDVEIKHVSARHLYLTNVVRCEFRRIWTHDVQPPPGPGHEGIDLITGSCWNLVEDNIIGPQGGFPAIILGDGGGGCAGNVITYNYGFGNGAGGGYDISLNHGAHNLMNLVEGNAIQNYQDDGYFGSCSHNTIFRNKVTDTIRLKHYSTYYNIVGNVIGRICQAFIWNEGESNPCTGGDPPYPALYQPPVACPASNVSIFQFGYPNAGNYSCNGSTVGPTDPPDYTSQAWHLSDDDPSGSGPGAQELDLNVASTMILHGNFDYVNNAVVWDQNISDHTIPNSLYYSSTPSWWPDGVAWPPIGPDRDPIASQIPAQIRYATMQNPPPPLPPPHGLRILP